MTGIEFADSRSHAVVKRTPLLALIILTILLGLCIIALARSQPTSQAPPIFASPAANPSPSCSPREFLPLLQRASEQADRLVALGESRERNLLRIRAEQSAMLTTLAEADAWLAAHPATMDDSATAAYSTGAADIRTAMAEAQAGFLRFDFERVARANDTLQAGAQSLRQAIGLLDPP